MTLAALAFALAGQALAEDRAAARYQRCVWQVAHNAQAALDAAQEWESEGGGTPAGHCAALALLSMGHATDAAARLQALATGNADHGVDMKAALYNEAGNAWLVAEEPARAISAFSAAIALAQNHNLPTRSSSIFYADRARALVLTNDRIGARRDLDHSIALAPSTAALTLRARLKRESNARGAGEDLEAALKLDPQFAEAFLERGRMEAGAGDVKSARQDFLQAAMLQEDGPVREAAQREMAALDLKIGR